MAGLGGALKKKWNGTSTAGGLAGGNVTKDKVPKLGATAVSPPAGAITPQPGGLPGATFASSGIGGALKKKNGQTPPPANDPGIPQGGTGQDKTLPPQKGGETTGMAKTIETPPAVAPAAGTTGAVKPDGEIQAMAGGAAATEGAEGEVPPGEAGLDGVPEFLGAARGRDNYREDVPKTVSVSDSLREMVKSDSPIMRQARTAGLQTANRRGLLNSSMAVQASQAAAYEAATPIASQESQQSFDAAQQARDRNSQAMLKDWELKSADRNAAATFLSNMEQVYAQQFQAIMANEKLSKSTRNAMVQAIQRRSDRQRAAVEGMYNIQVQW